MPVAIDFLLAQREKGRLRSADEAIAWVADRQFGLITRRQLIATGLSSAAIGRRAGCGRLWPIHAGVYAIGRGGLSAEGCWLAGVLAGGEGSFLSHRAAMAHQKLGNWSGFPEITSARGLHRRPGLIIHRALLPPDETMLLRGIPVTRPSRTLFDLAAVLDERGLRRALNEAAYLGLTLSPSLPELIDRHPRRRGIATLKRILAAGRVGLERTESDFEDEFLEWLEKRGFPPAVHQHPVTVGDDDYRLDLAWPDLMVAVELDTPAGHDHAEAIERDKRKDRRVRSVGWHVFRITARAFELEREEVETDLWAALTVAAP